MKFRDALLKSWTKPNLLTGLLKPLSPVYRGVFSARKLAFEKGLFKRYKAPVPVIVVGNLTVGGTGKTPLVIHLVEQLEALGFRPGVISRGYSGNAPDYPLFVGPGTQVEHSGDEAALILRRTGVPIMVGPDRRASIEALLREHSVDVIISDDGLQHFALERDIEVCLIDDTSPHENANMLPAGPYREPLERLMSVDYIVRHGGSVGNAENQFVMHLAAAKPQPVSVNNRTKFDVKSRLHALAGIGNPQRFFNTCEELGYDFTQHEFPDHHHFSAEEVRFGDATVLMTEKDAVKCAGIADDRHWYLPVSAVLDKMFSSKVAARLTQIQKQPVNKVVEPRN